MSALIASLDAALASNSEEIILRRVVGTAPNTINVDVTCRARIDALTTEQLNAGILASDLNIIISPTQINNAQWPGGNIPALPPFNVDQRIPREGGPDKVLLRGKPIKTVVFCDPKFAGNGELVRINMRVTG